MNLKARDFALKISTHIRAIGVFLVWDFRAVLLLLYDNDILGRLIYSMIEWEQQHTCVCNIRSFAHLRCFSRSKVVCAYGQLTCLRITQSN